MQEHDVFGIAAQHAPAGPALDALDEWAHVEGPILGVPAAEILRQLASSYMDNPDSQVHMVRVERGPTGGIRVTITLEIQEAGRL
jgi:hypothetical protein